VASDGQVRVGRRGYGSALWLHTGLYMGLDADGDGAEELAAASPTGERWALGGGAGNQDVSTFMG
jgi:hypothetical protein